MRKGLFGSRYFLEKWSEYKKALGTFLVDFRRSA